MKEIDCLLIRHGKTQGNIEKRYIGCKTDEELCAAGKEELECGKLVERTKLKVGSKVYISPMLRCIQSADILLPECEKKAVNDFREIDFGEFENKSYKELNGDENYQRWIDSNGTMPFPKGESREVFIVRNVKAFKDVLLKECGESSDAVIPFVIHGGSIMAIMSSLTGENYFDFQISCGEGILVKCLVGEGKIDVISYDRIYGRCDT